MSKQALRAAFEPAEGAGENGVAIEAEGETVPLHFLPDISQPIQRLI